MQKQKPNYRPIIFTAALGLAAAAALFYFTRDDAPTTIPMIQTAYYNSNLELADAIETKLQSEIVKHNYFWIGHEPDNVAQLELTNLIKQKIEKQNGVFDIVIVDKELMLGEEKEKFLGMTHEIPLKENFEEVAKLITDNKDKRILVITASIYSTNFIGANPHGKINLITQLKPFALSMGFFPVANNEERRSVFKCDTEDKTGTAPWGCAVINKARTVRRKLDIVRLNEAPAPRVGLMDSTGETDYMVLVGK